MSYFNFATGLTMTNKKFDDLFGQPVRKSEEELLTQFHMDIAASVQAVTEEIVLRLTKNIDLLRSTSQVYHSMRRDKRSIMT